METIKENPLYVYKPTIFKHHGPSFPGFDDILKKYVAFKIYFFFFKYRNINKCFQKKKKVCTVSNDQSISNSLWLSATYASAAYHARFFFRSVFKCERLSTAMRLFFFYFLFINDLFILFFSF